MTYVSWNEERSSRGCSMDGYRLVSVCLLTGQPCMYIYA